MKTGDISSLRVLRAFQHKAIKLDERTNCVTDWLEEADNWAEQLDKLSQEERGPLHGIPISIKECYDVQGYASTAGMAKFASTKADFDCPAVEMIKKLGGVPFCKTNVPQVMYSMQCSNPVNKRHDKND